MVLIDALPVSIASGTQSFGPTSFPDGDERVVMRLKRFTTLTPLFWLDAATQLTGEVDISYDSGTSWQHVCTFTSAGGLFVGPGGVEATEMFVVCDILRQPNRQVRGRITVTNGPLVSELTVESVP